MTPTERKFQDINDRLDKVELEILTYRQGLVAEFEGLKHEAEVHKKLTVYSRRTWFEMMAYIFFVGVLISDLARAYATNQWWGLVLWATEHGDGGINEWIIRGIGFTLQVLVLIVLGIRSQVPPEVFDRVPYAQVKRNRRRV